MYSLRIFIYLIFIWSSSALSAGLCQNLFYSHNENFNSAVTPFINQFAGKFELKDHKDFIATSQLVNTTAIRFAADPGLRSHTGEFLLTLKKIIEERELDQSGRRDSYVALLRSMVELLELNIGSVELWKRYLLSEKHDHSPAGTIGYLLQLLPSKTKIPLLSWLGKEYSGPKKRVVTKPIHILLNPAALYRQFKKDGRSDREFYNEYIRQIKKKALSDSDGVGGYTGDMVIEVARAIQTYLKSKPDMQAINFLGSVPNGFATVKSDLDIFNHPDKSFYPDKAEAAEKMGYGFSKPNPIEEMMTQIDDPALNDLIFSIIGTTPWAWHLENHGNRADDDFSAGVHIFSFHITKEKIFLRFYDPFTQDQAGNLFQSYHYINLDIDPSPN